MDRIPDAPPEAGTSAVRQFIAFSDFTQFAESVISQNAKDSHWDEKTQRQARSISVGRKGKARCQAKRRAVVRLVVFKLKKHAGGPGNWQGRQASDASNNRWPAFERCGNPLNATSRAAVTCRSAVHQRPSQADFINDSMSAGRPGWGGRDRTSAWGNQNPLPYRLATPQ